MKALIGELDSSAVGLIEKICQDWWLPVRTSNMSNSEESDEAQTVLR